MCHFQTLTLCILTFIFSATGAFSADAASCSLYERQVNKPAIQPAAYCKQKFFQPPIEIYNPLIEMIKQD